jgi:hypothetical protein
MRKSVGFLAIAVGLIVGLSWSLGCRDDIVVPFPPTLAGDYTGTYRYVEISSGINTLVDTTQTVDWRFTNTTYNMKVVLPTEEVRFFCDCAGDYELVSGVQLIETDDNLTNKVCTPLHNPKGAFGLDQSSIQDTILIAQDLTEESIRRIKVLKLTLD